MASGLLKSPGEVFLFNSEERFRPAQGIGTSYLVKHADGPSLLPQ